MSIHFWYWLFLLRNQTAFWLEFTIYEKVCDEVNMSKAVVDFEEMTKSGANLLPFPSAKNNAK